MKGVESGVGMTADSRLVPRRVQRVEARPSVGRCQGRVGSVVAVELMFIKHLFLEQRERLSESEETGPVRKPPRRGFCEHWLARCVGYELFGELTVRFSAGF